MKASLLLFLIYFLVSFFIPVFDGNDFVFVWELKPVFDARSPLNFEVLNRLFNGEELFFEQDAQIPYLESGSSVDFFETQKGLFPRVKLGFLFIMLVLVYPFFILGFRNYSTLIFLQTVFAALSVVIFYLIIKMRYSSKQSFFLSLIFGFGTGLLIYSKFFFKNILETLLFLLVLYFFIRFDDKKHKKDLVLFSFFSILFSLMDIISVFRFIPFIGDFIPVYFLYVVFFYIYLSRSKKTRKKVLRSFSRTFLILLFLVFFIKSYSGDSFDSSNRMYGVYLFKDFFDYNPASYNFLGEGKDRDSALIYSINEDGFFFSIKGFFDSFFSERGLVLNSFFLIFGVFYLSKSFKHKFLFLAIIFLNLLPSFFLIGYGGFTPRYYRTFFIAMTLFSILAIKQFFESGKVIKSFFLILCFFSVLNVFNLSIRPDWSYERSSDVFSKDLILFTTPFERNLGSFGDWRSSSTCKVITDRGRFVLDNCFCNTSASLSKDLFINNSFSFKACSYQTGYDGIRLFIEFNDSKREFYLDSLKCDTFSINIKSGFYKVKIYPSVEGLCDQEMIKLYGYTIN